MGCNDWPACLQICCCFPLCAVLFPSPLERVGQGEGRWKSGEWEKAGHCYFSLCFWPHLLQLLPLLSGLVSPAQLLPLLAPWATPPRALASIGYPGFWLLSCLSSPRGVAAPCSCQPLGCVTISCWLLSPSIIWVVNSLY